MNAMKFATSARSSKALFLLEIGEKEQAETLFKQVIEEFKELEPRNALFVKPLLEPPSCISKARRGVGEIDDLVKLDEFKERHHGDSRAQISITHGFERR